MYYTASIGSDSLDNILQLLSAIVIFCLVLAVTYLTARWIGQYQKKQLSGKNIRVLESTQIAAGKYLQIVKIGKKYAVIGISKDTITKIADLEEDDLEVFLQQADTSKQESFQEILNKLKNFKSKSR